MSNCGISTQPLRVEYHFIVCGPGFADHGDTLGAEVGRHGWVITCPLVFGVSGCFHTRLIGMNRWFSGKLAEPFVIHSARQGS